MLCRFSGLGYLCHVPWIWQGVLQGTYDQAPCGHILVLKYAFSSICRHESCEVAYKWTGICRQGWYEGLSEAFLGVKSPKVLMLAGTDRLDRTLTIGQMQGRFQMVLLPQVQPLALSILLCMQHPGCGTDSHPLICLCMPYKDCGGAIAHPVI